MMEVIAWIVVIGSLGTIFFKAVEETNFESPWKVLWSILLFVPIIIVSAIIHVVEHFKSNKLGYTVLLIIAAIIIFGIYKGLQYGPSSGFPWDG